MAIKDALQYGIKKLKNSSKTSRLDCELILAHVLQKSKEFIFTHPEFELSQKQKNCFERLIFERKNHKPVAYITGKKEFYSLEFFVNRNVLIPRPETELLVEKALKEIHKLCTLHSKPYTLHPTPITILDLGTGSGCIAISIAKNVKAPVKITASDICKKALGIAEKNAKYHGVKIKIIQSDLLKNIKKSHFPPHSSASRQIRHGASRYQGPDIIVANLPYITPKVYQKLAPEITRYEPKKALIAKTRNYFYEKLKQELKKINWNPILIFES